MFTFNTEIIMILAVAIIAGFGLGLLFSYKKVSATKKEADRIKNEAIKEAEAIKKEAEIQAKDLVFKTKAEIEQENKDKKQEFIFFERRLIQKEEHLDKKVEQLDRRESEIFKREKNLAILEKQVQGNEKKYDEMLAELKNKLESVARLTSEEAKNLLLKQIENELRHDAARLVKTIEDETKETADKKAKEIISLAIQRYAGDYVAEKTVSYVNLPNEEMKGRIIGREGRNIRAIEAATGVDLIIDETPEAVILSCHNPVKREVARVSLEKLISDGRIHPARIEEIVEKVKVEVDEAIKEAGESATFDLGVHGIHPELVKIIGKLKYRTSYAQNILQHSIEVGFLCGIMAGELGLNIKQAKRAGLLHDIGKAVDHEVEGSHALIGAELARKFNESHKIVKAIASHHYEEDPDSPLAVLVAAADALSAARPGARREMFETYVKRIEELEKIASSFKGVEKSYAIQAGREIRIIVESREILDTEIALLSHEIAKKIEKDLNYPGQIKITVIRETRAIDYAR